MVLARLNIKLRSQSKAAIPYAQAIGQGGDLHQYSDALSRHVKTLACQFFTYTKGYDLCILTKMQNLQFLIYL